jgi:hypothetical protein
MVKKRKTIVPPKTRQFIIPALITLCIISIIVLVSWIKIIEERIYSLDNAHLQNVLTQAVDDIAQPVVLDPKTGEVFFHEARVFLPPAPQGRNLKYTIQGDDPLTIELTDPSSYHDARSNLTNTLSMEETFEKLPTLQACVRAYRLVFGTLSEDNFILKDAINLADGRKVSLYLNEKCSTNDDTFVPYLKQLQSY